MKVGVPGIYRIEVSLDTLESDFYDVTDDISVSLSPCIGDGKRFEAECEWARSPTCGPDECRVCDVLTHEEIESPDADAGSKQGDGGVPKSTTCVTCRCEPNGF